MSFFNHALPAFDRYYTISFETARNENEIIKYYFEMEVDFYRFGPEETDIQHTTARFYITPKLIGSRRLSGRKTTASCQSVRCEN